MEKSGEISIRDLTATKQLWYNKIAPFVSMFCPLGGAIFHPGHVPLVQPYYYPKLLKHFPSSARSCCHAYICEKITAFYIWIVDN
jgi:hypothetical protein